jgi:hypothetical protein
MRPPWKIIGLAGLAGVAATGVIVARKRRTNREYDPDELRERLHRRLAEASTNEERDAGTEGRAGCDEHVTPNTSGTSASAGLAKVKAAIGRLKRVSAPQE